MGDEDNTVVVEFPIDAGQGVRTLDDVQLWEQLGLAAFLQRHWADNQVKNILQGRMLFSFDIAHSNACRVQN